MAEESKGIWQVLRHPLLLLIIGSTIGSFLFPWIHQNSERKRAWREVRLKRQLEIANNNTMTTRQLYSLVTHLNKFHSDNIRLNPTPAKLIELQNKLAKDMNASYAEFEKEKSGWWWPISLSEEVVILQIVPPGGSDKLRNDAKAYIDNIAKTVNAIFGFWHICLSKEYDFENGEASQIQKKMTEQLDQLNTERTALMKNFAQNFSTEQ